MSKRRADAIVGAALLFAALGDPTRLALLQRLAAEGPATLTALAQRFEMSRQGVTKHLQVLAAAGVIEGLRDGRAQLWALNPASLIEAQQHLDRIARGWDAALDRLTKHLEG